MSLLYRVGDEIVIEASAEAWRFAQAAIEKHLATYPCFHKPGLAIEVTNLANAIRAHIQHLESYNADLI